MVKEIPLTKGAVALVDDEDFEYLSQFRWHLSSRGYAKTQLPKGRKEVFMHRVIMDAPKGKLVDHINRDKLDNRKENLRFCSHSENQMNRESVGGASKYKGVFRSSSEIRPWKAVISVRKKKIGLGQYETEVEAAYAYDLAAKEYHGEFACLNGVYVDNFVSTKPKEPTSKKKGVYWHIRNERWVASIVKQGKQINLGSFKTEQEAIAARVDAEHKKKMGSDGF